jgi:hypothetical protein
MSDADGGAGVGSGARVAKGADEFPFWGRDEQDVHMM